MLSERSVFPLLPLLIQSFKYERCLILCVRTVLLARCLGVALPRVPQMVDARHGLMTRGKLTDDDTQPRKGAPACPLTEAISELAQLAILWWEAADRWAPCAGASRQAALPPAAGHRQGLRICHMPAGGSRESKAG